MSEAGRRRSGFGASDLAVKGENDMRQLGQGCLFTILAVVWLSSAGAHAADEDDLALAYGDDSHVTIATGSQQLLSRAPAVATVITSRDIAAMGVTQLEQVLESVPGLHVSTSAVAQNPIYSFRGIHTGYNPHVLMLVNGQPITNVFVGDRSQVWGGMPLENVARIEVIRGPGSALYGADAFSGVINIITKTAADIDGTQFGLRAGSFRTREAWVLHGGNLGPIAAAFYVGVGRSDGHKETIQRDLQSSLDVLFGTSASRAPGPISASRDAFDGRVDLALDNWRLRANYQQRELGVGTGIAEALDPDARAPSSRFYADLSYQATNWPPNWDITAIAGYYNVKDKPGDPAYLLFPRGAFAGTFPGGVIGNPGHAERHTYASASGVYTGVMDHRIRVGAGLRAEDLYKTTETKNFNFVAIPGVGPVFVPLPGVIDATGDPTLVFIQPHQRRVKYLFVQDEWSFAQDWALTAGVRHDRYSDFGGTINPRVALVWDADYNVVVKAMHGRAFRAPSFVEQYNINNPVVQGNPALRPETIITNEMSVSWLPTPSIKTNLSVFHYDMKDMIRFVPNADPTTGSTAQNSGGQKGRGMELEAIWDVSRTLRLKGHVALQRSTDQATRQDAGLAPRRKAFLRSDWRFAELWQFGTTINHVAGRKRQPGDARPPVADYTTVDMTLLREKFAGMWKLRATVLNAFDRDAREPSLAPGNIAFDIPLPGRTLFVQIEHMF